MAAVGMEANTITTGMSPAANGHPLSPLPTRLNGSADHRDIPLPGRTALASTLSPSSSQNQISNPVNLVQVPAVFLPDGPRSLSGISIRSFGLGISMGISALLTVQLSPFSPFYHYLWRLPFFLTTLSLFHYLEFDMTARYNTVEAKVSSFLLFTNGAAYNIAHTAAMLETLLRYFINTYFPIRRNYSVIIPPSATIGLGVILIVAGQITRSLAMKTAGTNFSHVVRRAKREGHVLVTNGIYSWLRHPSYFGFFWWGLGTQLVLGNHVCLAAYAFVLWKFFAGRIANEERHLVAFFGKEYLDYRQKTPVLIPFIQ